MSDHAAPGAKRNWSLARPLILNHRRRDFLRRSIWLAAAPLLAGPAQAGQSAVQHLRAVMQDWNDGVQAQLFSSDALAQTFTESDITDPFPYNGFYSQEKVPVISEAGYALGLSGLISDKTSWSLERLRSLPQESQITQHICVEGWSAIGKWGGVNLGYFLRLVGADTTAKYVGFKSADNYYCSIDMATALQPQTIMALTFLDQPLPHKFGFPMKIRMPTKLGFKNPKFVMAMFVTNEYPGGYWEDRGYNWFSGL